MATIQLKRRDAYVTEMRAYINERRDQIEQSPVVTSYGTFDADQVSEVRFRRAIERWDDLGLDTIEWTLADNTRRILTIEELQDVFEQAMRGRDLRALQVHQFATALKDQLPKLTKEEVDQAEWPLG